MKRKKKITKTIASQSGITTVESGLPLPYVYYPGFYGAYFAFGENENSIPYFCSCSKKSIENYIEFRLKFKDRPNSDRSKNLLLSSSHFPKIVVENLMQKKLPEDKSILETLYFKESICHECCKVTPQFGYCHPMYGGVFEQNYGWYINKQSFEYGVKPVSFQILENECPDELFENVEIGKKGFLEKYSQIKETELIMLKAQDSVYQKETIKIRNIIENECRAKFGFKKVGKSWANETLLYQIISQLYQDKKIYRHYRPDFLEFLELDVYIPELKLGFEYQGVQHFKSVEHWGGKSALKKVKERDARKKLLCEKNGIRLIYCFYYEELTKTLIRNKIKGNPAHNTQ